MRPLMLQMLAISHQRRTDHTVRGLFYQRVSHTFFISRSRYLMEGGRYKTHVAAEWPVQNARRPPAGAKIRMARNEKSRLSLDIALH